MNVTNKMMWKVYSGVLGAVSALVAHRLVTSVWKIATGDEPPSPTDPNVPATKAAIWALSSGIGIGAAQLAINRFTAKRYEAAVTAEVTHPGTA